MIIPAIEVNSGQRGYCKKPYCLSPQKSSIFSATEQAPTIQKSFLLNKY